MSRSRTPAPLWKSPLVEPLERRRLMSISVVAASGNAVVGGNGTYATFGPVSLSDNGSVAFIGTVAGTAGGSADNLGLFHGSAGRVIQFARTGDEFPGMDSDLVYTEFGAGATSRPIAIDADGELAFQATFRHATDGSTATAIIFATDQTTNITAFSGGDTADSNGTYAASAAFIAPAITPDGTVTVLANTTGRSDSAGQVVVSTPMFGLNTLPFKLGQASPDGDGTVGLGLAAPLANSGGTVALPVTFTGGTGGRGVVAVVGGTPSVVARVGTAVPLSGGAVFQTIGVPLQLDAANRIAFGCTYGLPNVTPAAGAGVFRVLPGQGIVTIARTGDANPAGGSFTTDFGNVFDMNESGTVLFSADGGLFLGNGGAASTVAVPGGAVAGFGTLVSIGVGNQFALNDGGAVVYAANRGGSSSADDGLFFQAAGSGTPAKVVAEGDALLGSTVTSFSLANGASLSAPAQGAAAQAAYAGFNNSGQVAFNFALADGRSGVAVWTADAAAAGNLDFGDAPDSYGTTTAADGACHVATGPSLGGAAVDTEANGIVSATASGDDGTGVDDEDGVTFSTLAAGRNSSVTLTTTTGGVVDGWIDFNADGKFDGTEQVVFSQTLAVGATAVPVTVPSAAVVGNTFARFRISTAGGLSPTGQANDGEVEDHQVAIAVTPPTLTPDPTPTPPPTSPTTPTAANTTVTISALDGLASETSGDTATLLVTRAGPTVEPLNVRYNLAGTADLNADYTGPTGSVDIPAGSTSARITITGIDDAVDEVDKTILVGLTNWVGYTVGTASVVTVQLADNDPAEATGATVGADLQTVGGVTNVKPGSFVGGAKGGAAKVRVLNAADATAAASGTVSVTFYASIDNAVETGDAVLATVTKAMTLKAGKSKVISAKFNYPAGLPDGSYFILARVDSGGAITEFREQNNDATSPAAIGVAAPFVDYAASGLTTKKTSVTPGFKSGKQKATVVVTNNGNVASSASVTVRFVASADNVFDASDTVLGDLTKALKIKPGKSAKATATIVYPTGLAAGTVVLLARVDAGGAVTEPVELDNDVVGPTVTVLV